MCDTIYTIDDIKAVLYPVFVKHSVKKAVLFGSYVKGMANQNSDVDLLLDSGLRNKIVHDYEGVNLVLIWDIVKEDLPELYSQLKELNQKL